MYLYLCMCACLTACVLLTEAMQIRHVSAPDWNRSLTYWPVLARPATSPPRKREGGEPIVAIPGKNFPQVAQTLTSHVHVSSHLLQLTRLVGVGVKGRRQDPLLLPVATVTRCIQVCIIIFIIIRRRGGAHVSLRQSLSRGLIRLPDLLKLGLDQHTFQPDTH